MADKIALFAFNGDQMCFIHVLLNTLDMHERGYDVRLVIEGSATKLVASMNVPEDPLHVLYSQVKEKGLVHCVCKACASKMGTLASAQEQGLAVCGPMKGHPSMAEYREQGYEVIVF
ncbi:MAG: DsrE family protein [Candidatus Thermoplasmatota archaeon]|nr:DsrE family protein [Candidatus Thermoplasmatota archaeon]